MAAGFPDGPVHEDGTVQTDDVVPHLGHGFPPMFLQVALQLGPEGAVVPGAVQAPVDLGGREDESPALAQRDDFFHAGLGHKSGLVGFPKESC